MEGCSIGTFFGYLLTEHAALSVIGIVVELAVIVLAVMELVHRGKDGAALKGAKELLHRYTGAVQMAKAVPAVAQSKSLVEQLDDLGSRYAAWKARWEGAKRASHH
jgi:hypothetical protein